MNSSTRIVLLGSFLLAAVIFSASGQVQQQLDGLDNRNGLPQHFAKKFAGTVGDKQATFFIQGDEGTVSGEMYFENAKEAFWISGDFQSDGAIRFKLSDIGKLEGVFHANSIIEGIYTSASEEKHTQVVRLTEMKTGIVDVKGYRIGHSKCVSKWDEELFGTSLVRDSSCYSRYLSHVVIRLEDDAATKAVNDSIEQRLYDSYTAEGLEGGIEEMREMVWQNVEKEAINEAPAEFEYYPRIHSFNRNVLCLEFHEFLWVPEHPRGGDDYYIYENYYISSGKPIKMGDLMDEEGLLNLNKLVIDKITLDLPIEELYQEALDGIVYDKRTNFSFDLLGITIPIYRNDIGPGYLESRDVFVSFEELRKLPGKKSKVLLD